MDQSRNESKIKHEPRFPKFNIIEWLSLSSTSLLILATLTSLTLEGIIKPSLLQEISKALMQESIEKEFNLKQDTERKLQKKPKLYPHEITPHLN